MVHPAPSLPPSAPASAPAPWISRVRRFGSSPSFRPVAETVATRVLLLGLSALTGILAARLLGPAGRGYHAAAVVVGGIALQLGTLGLHASNTYFAARTPALAPRLFANSLVTGLGFGALVALAGLTAILLRPELAPVHGRVLVLTLAAIPFSLATLLLQSLLLGIHEVRDHNRVDVVSTVLAMAVLAVAAASGSVTVEVLMGGGLAASVATFAWTARSARRRLPVLAGPSWPLFREGLRFGTRAYLSAFFAFLVQRLDVFLLARWTDAEQTGYYVAAVSVATVATVFPGVVGTLVFPRLASVPDPRDRWHITRRAFLLAGAVMAVVAALVAAFAPWIVRLLFGEAFAPAVAPLRWSMLAVWMLSSNSILMKHFSADGTSWVVVYSPALATLVNVGLNALLIPGLGTVGAALASVASYAAMLAVSGLHLAHTARRGPGPRA